MKRRCMCSMSRRVASSAANARPLAAAPHPPRRAVRGLARRLGPRARRTGARPKVFLANLGKLVRLHGAHAVCAGTSSRPAGSRRSRNDGFASRDEMIAAFKASGAKLACLCSSDKVYAAEAVDAAKALTAAGARTSIWRAVRASSKPRSRPPACRISSTSAATCWRRCEAQRHDMIWPTAAAREWLDMSCSPEFRAAFAFDATTSPASRRRERAARRPGSRPKASR